MTRSCDICANGLTCFLRIEFRRTIQSFKLLADNAFEAERSGLTKHADNIFLTIAQACTAYREVT